MKLDSELLDDSRIIRATPLLKMQLTLDATPSGQLKFDTASTRWFIPVLFKIIHCDI